MPSKSPFRELVLRYRVESSKSSGEILEGIPQARIIHSLLVSFGFCSSSCTRLWLILFRVSGKIRGATNPFLITSIVLLTLYYLISREALVLCMMSYHCKSKSSNIRVDLLLVHFLGVIRKLLSFQNSSALSFC
jgi:hypothetical protein